MQAPPIPVTVNLVAVPETVASGLYGFIDVLSSVGVAWESVVTHTPVTPQFDVRIVAASARPFRCVTGALITPDVAIAEADADAAQIVLIPAVQAASTERWRTQEPPVYEWLSGLDPSQTRLVSACTGALLLAEASVLNGHEATTHWAYRDLFRRFYPEVRLRPERNICVSGRDACIVTSGGASAWQTLALFLIAQYCGPDRATQTAKFWLISGAGDRQLPYSAMLIRQSHKDQTIEQCEFWIRSNLTTSSPVESMIELSGLSATTFSRRFRRATGYTPIEYVQAARIEESKWMLESGSRLVDEVSRQVGYGDTVSFRRLFKRHVGITPSEYRKRFGGARFDAIGDSAQGDISNSHSSAEG
jgi:transcriptional regulator GlxA family with amidase domain